MQREAGPRLGYRKLSPELAVIGDSSMPDERPLPDKYSCFRAHRDNGTAAWGYSSPLIHVKAAAATAKTAQPAEAIRVGGTRRTG